jgi:hypothetical protein
LTPRNKNQQEPFARKDMTTMTKTRMWKDGTRRGIVYVEARDAAEKVMALRPAPPAPSSGSVAATPARGPRRRNGGSAVNNAAPVPAPGARQPAAPPPRAETELVGAAMAVYLDRKGKPFAWQIPFDIADWDRVTALVGGAPDGFAGGRAGRDGP